MHGYAHMADLRTQPALWMFHLRSAEREMVATLRRSTGAAYVRISRDLADVRALAEHVEAEYAVAEMIARVSQNDRE